MKHNLFNLSLLLFLHSFLHEFGLLSLQFIIDIFEVLVIALILNLKKFFLTGRCDLGASKFVFHNLGWHIGDNQSDDDLEGNNDMLQQNSEKNNICAIPVIWVFIFKILN